MIENKTQRMHSRCWHKSRVPGYWSKQRPRMRLKKSDVERNACNTFNSTCEAARRSENLVAKKVICFLPSSYFSATQQGVDTDEAKTITRWLPARPHTCPLIVYTWNYLSCFPQLAASNQNSTAGFSNRKGTSQYTLNPTVTRRNYTAHVPLAPYTCSDIRTHRMHTPCVLYTTPARTVRANRAHRTRTPRAPYAHPARTPRTPRTHTPHAHTARPVRTPSRTRTVGYKSKPCSHHSWI